MARRKKSKKAARARDGKLENLLRFEIVVVLFSLIGLYYFLSFSPVRMPSAPISSPRQNLGPAPVAADPPAVESPELAMGSSEAEPDGSPAALAGETVATEKSSELPAGGQQAQARVDVSSSPAAAREAEAEDLSGSMPVTADAQPGDAKAVKPGGDGSGGSLGEEVPRSSPDAADPQVEKTAVGRPVALSAAAAAKAVSGNELPPTPALPLRKHSRSHKPRRQVIEVGAYVLDREATAASEKLRALGLPFVSRREKRPTSMYRVFLGPFASAAAIEKAMAAARRLGDRPFARQVNGLTQVVIGSFYLQSSVVAWENLYHDAGLQPRVEKGIINLPRTVLRIEDQVVLADSAGCLEKLRTGGLPEARLIKYGQ